MSTLADIITQVNTITGYMIPSASGYVISASNPVGSGSVNNLINYVNTLTGYSIPATSASFVSGGNLASTPIVIYAPAAPTGTISTDGIYPGAIIKADHVLRIIRALNGQAQNDIIISGSLTLPSGSLFIPPIPDGELLESVSGTIEGTDIVDGGSY